MADEILENNDYIAYTPYLFGRRPILTSIDRLDPNDPDSIITEVNESLDIHVRNLLEMEYLYWYRRGVSPVLGRKKEVRPEICAKIPVNYADEIASFKNGWFLTQPAFYIARNKDESLVDKVSKYNDYIYRSGKQLADNKVVDWFDTCGKGCLFVKANDDRNVPFRAYALDPRSAYVVKSLSPGNHPVYSVHTVVRGEELIIDVSDDTNTYTLRGTVTGKLTTPESDYICTASEVIDIKPNPIKHVPIIEYYYNSVQMGAFESVIPLINATSFLQSDRLDGVDQAVQSLLVFYNCELEDDEGNDISVKSVRQDGALFLKSIGENKADLKEIVTNLDQSQIQVFIDNLRDQILSIAAMPNNMASRGYGNHATGTVALVDNGWYQADTSARNTEDLFHESNAYFDEIVMHILREKKLLDLDPADVKLQFVRNETFNAQSKAQTFVTYMQGGLHPELALAKSGASNDPVADYEVSKEWIDLRWRPQEVMPDSVNPSAEDPNAPNASNAADQVQMKGQVKPYYQMRNGIKTLIGGYDRGTEGRTE